MQLEKPIKIIDRTLLYLAPNAKTAYISEYFKYMLETGVKLFEVDKSFKHFGFVDSRNVLLRLNHKTDISYGKANKIKRFILDHTKIINEEFCADDLVGLNLILDIPLSEDEIFDEDFISKAIASAGVLVIAGCNVKTIRISNVKELIPEKYLQVLLSSLERHHITLDLCCSNALYLATTIAISSISANVSIISGSFSGISKSKDTTEQVCENTCIEEVMASLNVFTGKNKFNLTSLQKIKKFYELATNYSIEKYKPILGRDIFKYESGIHANAITKSPDTYEPFNPQNVGLERELCIGKHSGTEAIRQILLSKGVCASAEKLQDILEKVRAISIKQKSSISASQLYELAFDF